MASSTPRQQIAEVLRHGPFSVFELSRKLSLPVKAVLEDLEHVRRSVRSPNLWIVDDAQCLSCGFVFHGRHRLNRPSRCPRCRSEDLQDARYAIQSSHP
jgi:predicted Zn-ribbon and HTH transcriptional regulator